MGYMHINNLYKDGRILEFPECYALEKIHGTSAHVRLKGTADLGLDKCNKVQVVYFSGGESHEKFKELFSKESLQRNAILWAESNFTDEFTLEFYGEAYGGKQQGMSGTYGKDLKFIVFDVRLNGNWLSVPMAEALAKQFDFEFVDYVRVPTTIEALNQERDRPSVQAVRNGIQEPKQREGVVLRPLTEMLDVRGDRVITKHKGESFRETKTKREVSLEELAVLADAKKIAEEWVTPMRLEHVLDHARAALKKQVLEIEDTGTIIKLMKEDVLREAVGEIIESKAVLHAISTKAAIMFKKIVTVVKS